MSERLKHKRVRAAWRDGLPFVIAAVALVLRLIFILQIQNTPLDWGLVTDATIYEQAAREIASGNLAYQDYAIINPFYPYFAGLIYRLIGFHPLVLLVIQAIVDTASTLLIYSIARSEIGEIAAIVASSAYSLDRMAIFYSGIRIATTLEIFLALAFAALILRMCRGKKTSSFILPGVIGGLLSLARPSFFLVLGVISLWLLLVRRRDSGTRAALISFAGLSAGLGIVLCLVSLRNLSVSGDARPLPSQSGLLFYIGNNPQATGFFSVPPQIPSTPLAAVQASVYLARRETGRDLTPTEASQYWFARATGFMRSHPWQEARLLAKKLLLCFRKEEAPVNVIYDLAFRDVPLLRLPLVSFGFVVPVALLGIAIALIRKSQALLIIYLFAYVGSVALFFVSGRYRLPIVPVVLMFAGLGVQELGRWVIAARWRAVGLSLAAVSGFAVVTAYDLPFARFSANPADHYHNLGTAYYNRGFTDQAGDLYRKAIQVDPNFASAYYMLGVISEKTGPDSALVLFQRTIALDPLHAKAHLHLGVLWAARGQPDWAADQFAQTLALDPSNADAHAQLGDLLFDRRLYPQAVEHYSRALEVNPRNASAWFNAGAACYGMKTYGQALEFFAGYLRLVPGDTAVMRYVREIKAIEGEGRR